MAFVQKLNVILEVDDESLPKYLHTGYAQIDQKTGKIITPAVPVDFDSMKLAYHEQTIYVQKLEEENKKLKAENRKLKSKASKE